MTPKNQLHGKRILLVDDEQDILDTLEELLLECETQTADCFEDARALLKSDTFDLAILDIMGVDGYKLLQIANENNITAVMLTARALSPDNVVRSYKEGAAYYIPKEEMVNITTLLDDIFKAKETGKNTWDKWFDRLGKYCEKRFGPDWQKEEKIFWEKFPFH